MIDVVAIGQVTPGPLFTTATSVGYLVAGFKGAALATVAIFLPSFLFVPLVNSVVPRLRNTVLAAGVLDGVNAASLGLMAAVTIQLARVSRWLTLLQLFLQYLPPPLYSSSESTPHGSLREGALWGFSTD